MYALTTHIPLLRPLRRIPLSRDQMMLLMAAINEIFLGVDHYTAHLISGTIVIREWIPIVFGPVAGVLLLVGGLIALRNRPVATVLGSLVLVASVAVGLLGAYYHFVRAILPSGPAGARVGLDLLVWAPPILGPLFLSFVGVVGISAVFEEEPPGSGRVQVLPGRHVRLPYSKTRAYLFLIGMGILATTISSVLDHARTGFENPWLWVPTLVGIFALAVSIGLGAVRTPQRADVLIYVGAMLLLILVGLVGFVLHVQENLVAGREIVLERFLRGAPFMAPTLFANVGLLGLIVLWEPRREA